MVAKLLAPRAEGSSRLWRRYWLTKALEAMAASRGRYGGFLDDVGAERAARNRRDAEAGAQKGHAPRAPRASELARPEAERPSRAAGIHGVIALRKCREGPRRDPAGS